VEFLPKKPPGARFTRRAATAGLIHPNAAGYEAMGGAIDLRLI
jgi:hypothetical protein